MAAIAVLFNSMKEVEGTMGSFRGEMRGDVNEVKGAMENFRGEAKGWFC